MGLPLFNSTSADLEGDLDPIINNRSINPIRTLSVTIGRLDSATGHNQVEIYSPTTEGMNRMLENHRLVNALRVPRPISSRRNELRQGGAFTIFEDDTSTGGNGNNNNNSRTNNSSAVRRGRQPLSSHLRLDIHNGATRPDRGIEYRNYVQSNNIYDLPERRRQLEAEKQVKMAIQALSYPFDEEDAWILEHIRNLLKWRFTRLRDTDICQNTAEMPMIRMPENKFEAAKLAHRAIRSFSFQYIASCGTAFGFAALIGCDSGEENYAP